MDKKGVTIMELLIVVAIIGILAAIAIPSYVGQQKKASRTEAYSNLEALRVLQEQHFAEYGEYADRNAAADIALGAGLRYVVGTTTIQTQLPGFKPGDPSTLKFDYDIGNTVSSGRTTGFTARAIGKAGTNVVNETYTINQDNVKVGW